MQSQVQRRDGCEREQKRREANYENVRPNTTCIVARVEQVAEQRARAGELRARAEQRQNAEAD